MKSKKRKLTPSEKASNLMQVARFASDGVFYHDTFRIEENIKVSIVNCRVAIRMCEEFIESSYWWQFKRRFYFMAVKICLYTKESEMAFELNNLTKSN